MIFELINPSDTTTFEADSLSVAAFSAILLSPRYGVEQVDNRESRFFEFIGAVDAFTKRWGDPAAFLREYEAEIAACLDSFAYLSPEERQQYADALEAITDEAKREAFRAKHEDRNRSSMNKICRAAWEFAKRIRVAMESRNENQPVN